MNVHKKHQPEISKEARKKHMIKKKAFESFNIHLEPTAASSIQLSSLSVFHDNGLFLAWFNHYKDNNNQGICKKQQFKNSEG